jgi:glycosyltransferase involved in cell wall biosynthesis
MKTASLCVLAFERPEFLKRSINSLISNTSYPHERIINNDGSTDSEVATFLNTLQQSGVLSYLVTNCGQNMGVGKAFRNCIGVSSGDYIFKLDADLEYQPKWLETIISILDNNPDVGCCGLFNYRNYDPNDDRFVILEERDDCYIVSDFVNSGYGFRREIYDNFGVALGDDGWQQYVKGRWSGKAEYKLAIPKSDVAINFGFGANKSIYVREENGEVKVHGKSDEPKIFGGGDK